MTTTKAATTMTDPSQAQLDRLAKLRGRSPTAAAAPLLASRRPRRRHPAQSSRIVAAGLGAGTMLGIVTLLGLNNPVSQAEEPTPATQPAVASPVAPLAPPVEVRVHMIPAASSAATPDQVPSSEAGEPVQAGPESTAPAAPIELTANPVVRTVTVAAPTQARPQAAPSAAAPQPAPVATTSGSS